MPGIRTAQSLGMARRYRGTTTYAGIEPSAAEMAAFLPAVNDFGHFKRGDRDSVFYVHRRSDAAAGGYADFAWVEMAPVPQSSLVALTKHIVFGDASPITLPVALKAGDLLVGAKVMVTLAFNDAAATLQLGTTNLGVAALHGATHNNLAALGTYTTDDFVAVTMSDAVTITITPGTSTQGAATVVIFFVERV